MKKLTLGSLFSGSGGFEVAGILSGIEPVFNSEVLPFAIRVTTKRLPQVRHYGDISKLNGGDLEAVDISRYYYIRQPLLDRILVSQAAGRV